MNVCIAAERTKDVEAVRTAHPNKIPVSKLRCMF